MKQEQASTKKQPNLPVLVVALAIHLVLVRLTWRDLRRRPHDGVRGNRKIWRMASALNTGGSVAYWLFGRREPTAP